MSFGNSRSSNAAALRSAFREYPVTLLCLAVSVILFLAVAVFDWRHPGHRFGGKSEYGAVTVLMFNQVPELKGLFQLWGSGFWSGQWWRMLTTGFHHGGVLHLLMNGLALFYLGRLLEPRLGSFKFLLFFLTATVISFIPHVAMSEAAVGLSGGIYALFGMLLAPLRYDEELQDRIPDGMVKFGLLWIPIGYLLNATGMMRIGNEAHIAGLAYGWLAGRVVFPVYEQRFRMSPRLFLAAHAVLIPAFLISVNPFWNARYYWYQSTRVGDIEKRIAKLQTALEWNPRLVGAWRDLAVLRHEQKQSEQKWRAIFLAIKAGPTDEKSLELVQKWWEFSSPPDRELAAKILRETFPETESEWRKQLGLFTTPRAWRKLAVLRYKQKQPKQKWQAIFLALKAGPTDEKSLKLVWYLWEITSRADRELALKVLRETFPHASRDWRQHLGLFTLPPYRRFPRFPPWLVRAPLPPIPIGVNLFWRPVDGNQFATPQPQTAPPVDPNHPNSAVLGRLL